MRKSRKLGTAGGRRRGRSLGRRLGVSPGSTAPRPPSIPRRSPTVERGTMTRSVVATGKVEPITKVEIKSKANGIIERLLVDVDQVVDAGPACSPSSTRKILPHGSARLAPTCRRPRPRAKRAAAQLKKNEIEAEAPDVAFARRNHERARAAVRAEAGVAVGARRREERARAGREPQARRQRPAGHRAGQGGRGDGQRRAGARPRSSAPKRSWPTPRSRRRSAPPC